MQPPLELSLQDLKILISVIVIFRIFSQLMQREDQLKEKSSSSDCDKTRTITKNCREQQDTGGTGSVLSKFYISPVGLFLDQLDLTPPSSSCLLVFIQNFKIETLQTRSKNL